MKILDKETFNQEVLESKGLVLVDFWSDKCENCIALMPMWRSYLKNLEMT